MWGLVCKVEQVRQKKFRKLLSRHLTPLFSAANRLTLGKLLYHFKLEKQCLGRKPGKGGLLTNNEVVFNGLQRSTHPQAGEAFGRGNS
jgi:hypothetical protein